MPWRRWTACAATSPDRPGTDLRLRQDASGAGSRSHRLPAPFRATRMTSGREGRGAQFRAKRPGESYFAVTLPCMNGCGVQWKATCPAAEKVWL